MTGKGSDKSSDSNPADLTPFAAELRGTLMVEALIAAFAVISYADLVSSLIERLRLLDVVAGDPLLAAFPKAVIAEEWAMQQRAFATASDTARNAALLKVARLAPEPHKARMVLDACIRIVNADKQAGQAEIKALRDIAAALQL
jgi:tellurite resistance protein